ncbi:hypothetical protein [Mucilaginibacter sp. dw_454]|uniref:DUF7009 family protein n=1 Tax=Mucilaginibacter sp. dw_454 TaxID=2720079 RepID=UPI001BD2737F|nr:hypothetical protein [Mucilaginibacter sp. dw_454]
MKIRIKGNSLRYRLTQSDVAQFLKTHLLQDSTSFGDKQLIYELKATDAEALTATFDGDKITVAVPIAKATELAETNLVGFDGKDGDLYLLIEKDFQCLDEVAEDQSDNYPNPLAQKSI